MASTALPPTPHASIGTVTAEPIPPRRTMTGWLTLLFAVAGGAAVGNLYWAQPLLELIADDPHASTATAGRLITATQIG